MTDETFFSKFKQAWLDQWKKLSTVRKIWTVLGPVLFIALIICFFTSNLSAKIFNAEEYKVYEYAIECVEDELKFPSTADFPSFKDCSIGRSAYAFEIALETYKIGSAISPESVEKVWDVSGYGTCENALGMTLNLSFTVTVVMSESGEFWCYKCDIN